MEFSLPQMAIVADTKRKVSVDNLTPIKFGVYSIKFGLLYEFFKTKPS
jgi:hypothetical protein